MDARGEPQSHPVSIAVVGDHRPGFEPQDSIESALQHSATALGVVADVEWVGTSTLESAGADVLASFDAVWCAPGSPFVSMTGALEGIRFAREHELPFLGTCAGFQHGVIEVARNVAGISDAAHGENEHETDSPLLIAELLCSLVGQTMALRLVDDVTRSIYGGDESTERYYCRFGLDERYVPQLRAAGLIVAGVDLGDGGTRIMRLVDHPFFLLTLFVPQTSSTPDHPHALISAYLAAAVARRVSVPSSGSPNEPTQFSVGDTNGTSSRVTG